VGLGCGTIHVELQGTVTCSRRSCRKMSPKYSFMPSNSHVTFFVSC